MARPKPGMGRGLEAILSVSRERERPDDEELRELPIELIAPNPKQPRRRFDEESLQALAGSLVERGVLQPVLVRPRAGGAYELIAGERRWRAARMAGLPTIPALVRPREDAEALELALIENMAREDLSTIEQAHACAAASGWARSARSATRAARHRRSSPARWTPTGSPPGPCPCRAWA